MDPKWLKGGPPKHRLKDQIKMVPAWLLDGSEMLAGWFADGKAKAGSISGTNPRRLQDGSWMVQDGPKMALRWSKDAQPRDQLRDQLRD